MHSVTPHMVCAGAAAAIEFYKEAFGADDLGRVAADDRKLMHAIIRIGDSPVMLVDEVSGDGSHEPEVARRHAGHDAPLRRGR